MTTKWSKGFCIAVLQLVRTMLNTKLSYSKHKLFSMHVYEVASNSVKSYICYKQYDRGKSGEIIPAKRLP